MGKSLTFMQLKDAITPTQKTIDLRFSTERLVKSTFKIDKVFNI